MNIPTIRPRFVLERTGGAFIARSEEETHFLGGDVITRLLSVIDGLRTADEIVDALAGEVDAAKTREALTVLERANIISDSVVGERAHLAFWELAGADPATVTERSKSASADIFDFEADAGGLWDAFAALGIPVEKGAPFRVVMARNYFHSHLGEINADALRSGRAWMLLRPFGRKQWIGPIFVPGETACWRCLTYFLRVNGWTSDAAAAATLPTASAATRTIAATEAAKWLLGGTNAELVGQIRAIDTTRLNIETHHVLRRPQCPDCGNVSRSEPRRAFPDRLLSRITGIVPDLTRFPDYGPLTAYRGQLSQIFRPSISGWLYVARQQVFGKGCTEEEARLSCLGEAVERYSIQYHGDECQTTAAFAEVDSAVNPALLVLCSETQHGKDRSPKLLPYRGERIAWARATSLVDGTLRHLPFAYCYMGYLDGFACSDSSGCAAGDSIEAAALGGLLEVIERDAVAIWWYNRVCRPSFDLNGCSDRITALVDHVESSGRRVHVLDVSTDWNIAVSVAVSSRADGTEITLGTAAALHPEESVWRALAEMAQHTALWDARTSGTDLSREAASWISEVTVQQQEYLLPAGQVCVPLQRRREQPSAATLLNRCVQRAAELQLDVIVLDATRPEIGVPVARVCVPGLRPWWPRFAPGRLYELPVRLGWIPNALTERELNPLPFPA